MNKDIRDTPLYREAECIFNAMRRTGTGQINEAAEICASPDGRRAVFAGTLVDTLEGVPPTRICLTDLATGDTRVLTFGPNDDRSPKFSPDGRHVAFLSDRRKIGDFQLYLLDATTGAARPTPRVAGWVESLHWSPDGQRILLGVADHGADVAGTQGAVSSEQVSEGAPRWLPAVEMGDESYRWRRVWVYELDADRVRQVSRDGCNVWEANWCGRDALVAVVSPGSREGLWYTARLHRIELSSGESTEIYKPECQLGCPAASPSGKRVVIVEALCSDRCSVTGELRLVDVVSGSVHGVDTDGVDVTYAEWRSERQLLLAGHRGLETVVSCYDVGSATITKMWSSADITVGSILPAVSGFGESGDCVWVSSGFLRAPEIALLCGGEYRSVKSFDPGCAADVEAAVTVERMTWRAGDGLELQGYLLRPKGQCPYPLVMVVHGGPIAQWRPMWFGGGRNPWLLMLLKRGYAIFMPNPRGSTGRGIDFARRVLGDMGGADTYDCLSGVDHLVEKGIADGKRLGVTGVSYGGFMTSWLVTQDSRFAAAVSVAQVSNQVTVRLISNIPDFTDMFLAESYANPNGKYFSRSPIMHAHRTKTPTLNIAGALDQCTPPEEAVQFHNALLENGVKSALVIYPEEGHGVRKFPAIVDYAARIVGWFEEHMCAEKKRSDSAGSNQQWD